MNSAHIILHLSLIDGVGPGTVQKIIACELEGFTLDSCYYFKVQDWQDTFGFSYTITQKLVLGLSDHALLAQEVQLLGKSGASFVTLLDDEYPELLRHIHLPPSVLYYKGASFSDYQNTIAIIGSRKANQYARRFIKTVVPDLVTHGWAIVSGGALGADSMAHHATLENGGRTIAVIGSGLMCPYPRSNSRLFEDIIANGGTVCSPFPLTMEGLPGNFPARNRIISGLSRGCVVVQAAKKSGAAITAHFALDQGREVFAVPGPLDDELSAGCHALIQQGAKLIASSEDVLGEFDGKIAASEPKQLSFTVPLGKPRVQTAKRKAPEPPEDDKTPQGIIIRSCLQACSVDELSEKTGLDLASITTILFDLQLEGKVAQNFMGMWERA